MADAKRGYCAHSPCRSETIGHKEDIRQPMDGGELCLGITKNTDLDKHAIRNHVNFGPPNVSFDDSNIRRPDIGFVAAIFSATTHGPEE